MSFLQKLKDLWCIKYYYITNRETLKKHVMSEVQFALDYDLEYCCQCFVFDENGKHRMIVLNQDAERSKKKPPLGVCYCCGSKEHSSFDALFDDCFPHLNESFQVMVEDNEPEVLLNEATRIQVEK